MERTLIGLKGLTCSNCAAKIERDVAKIKDVKAMEINLLKQEAVIEHIGNSEEIFQEAKKITAKYEPDVVVTRGKDHNKGNGFSHENENRCSLESFGCNGHCENETHEHSEHDHDEEFEHSHSHGEEMDLKTKLIQFGVGIALFLLAIFIKEPNWLNISLFMGAYLVLGLEVLLRALKNISRGQIFDENFLMSISTIGAIAIGEMPEAVFVMLFYQIGETFQEMAVEKSRKSIRGLMDIRPDYANIIIGNDITIVKPENVKVNDVIIVKPGERVPLDGIISEGETMLDTSALTGESVPRSAKVGSEVLSGVINTAGVIKIKVTKEFENSTVVKILELTENAAAKKTKTEKFITKFARIYTPAVVFAAVILALVPPLITGNGDFTTWISRSLIFLVISCPCALVLSVPLGFFAGIGESSRNGILVKGSNYLQALCEVNTVVLDKTGTVTEGVFKVTEVKAEGISEDELIRVGAYAEKLSNHPIAKSIAAYYEDKNEIDTAKIESYEEISGHGISAIIEGRKIFAGNMRLMDREGIKYEGYNGIGSVVYISSDGKYLGRIVVSDKIKKDSKKAIENLKKAGIKEVIMLTGDNKDTAGAVGIEIGIDKVYSQLLPGDKVKKVEEIYENKKDSKILFVGDGINDAPVLSRVEVGVAMGGVGSDAAIEASDVVIMNDNLLKLAESITIAKNTNKIVKQNIIFALGVKTIVLILGAVGIATMWMAVFADVGVALIAILNSMRKKI